MAMLAADEALESEELSSIMDGPGVATSGLGLGRDGGGGGRG